MGGGFAFQAVRLLVSPGPPADHARLELCKNWLLSRRMAQGDEPKKVLLQAARSDLRTELTTRLFDEAYRMVYERSRGRPRTS